MRQLVKWNYDIAVSLLHFYELETHQFYILTNKYGCWRLRHICWHACNLIASQPLLWIKFLVYFIDSFFCKHQLLCFVIKTIKNSGELLCFDSWKIADGNGSAKDLTSGLLPLLLDFTKTLSKCRVFEYNPRRFLCN